jgi:hypothetical protein
MKHQHDSQLFLVRLWPEPGSGGQTEWHGKLQHVVSGETHIFTGCPQLLDRLLEMLPPYAPAPDQSLNALTGSGKASRE